MPQPDVDSFRRLFASCGRFIHFNHAGTAPLPEPAVTAMRQVLERIQQDGDLPYPEAEAVVEQARLEAAKLMGADADEVGFVANTTAGILLAIASIEWRAGDNLVMMEDAFPSNSYPYRLNLGGVELRTFRSEELRDGTEPVFQLADRNTRAIALDWVHFLSGRRAAVEAVGRFCRERNIVFIVDGMQAVGVVDVDVRATGADFVAAGGNKWLMGPYGTGVLYVRRERLAEMKAAGLGWLSCKWDGFNDIFTPKPLKPGSNRFEAGTKNYPGLYGMGQSLKVLNGFGRGNISRRVELLCGRLRQKLLAAGFEIETPAEPERHAGIVTGLRPGADMAALFQRLTDGNVVCSLRENRLRFSPHFYNTEEEVDRLAALLERA